MDGIPLASILRYVQMAISYKQREIVDLLADRATALANTSSEAGVRRQHVSLKLHLLVGAVRGLTARRVTLPGVESQHS